MNQRFVALVAPLEVKCQELLAMPRGGGRRNDGRREDGSRSVTSASSVL